MQTYPYPIASQLQAPQSCPKPAEVRDMRYPVLNEKDRLQGREVLFELFRDMLDQVERQIEGPAGMFVHTGRDKETQRDSHEVF